MRRPPWWAGLPPASASVACGGTAHEIAWSAGRLRLRDHDLEAELALVALGGRAPLCVEVHQAAGLLRPDAYDPRVLGVLLAADAVGRRVVSEVVERYRFLVRGLAPVVSSPATSGLPPVPAKMVREYAGHARLVTVLMEVPEPLRRRIALGLLARWSTRLRVDHRATATIDFATRRIAEWEYARRRGLGAPKGAGRLHWTVWGGPASPLVDRQPGAWRVRLPGRWLLDVWGRGLTVLDGCFVLDVQPNGAGRRVATMLDWQVVGGRPEPVVRSLETDVSV